MPVTSAFFDDLSGTPEWAAGYNEPIYIVGYLNVGLDRDNDLNARSLTDLFDAFWFVGYSLMLNPLTPLADSWMFSLLIWIYCNHASLLTRSNCPITNYLTGQCPCRGLINLSSQSTAGRGACFTLTSYRTLIASQGYVDQTARSTVPHMISLVSLYDNERNRQLD